MNHNYNTQLSLWQNYTPAKPIQVQDGHFYEPGRGFIARFTSDAKAIQTLKQAGLVQEQLNRWVRSESAKCVDGSGHVSHDYLPTNDCRPGVGGRVRKWKCAVCQKEEWWLDD